MSMSQFKIHDNKLLSTLSEKEKNFWILKLTFSILYNNLVYNVPTFIKR